MTDSIPSSLTEACAIALLSSLKPGEIVLVLGCKDATDVVSAAGRVAPEGWAIGLDVDEEAIERARAQTQRAGVANVDFVLAPFEDLPIPDASVDCVLGHAIPRRTPEPSKTVAEIGRVLKPGGRLVLIDVALKGDLREIEPVRELLDHAGFVEIAVDGLPGVPIHAIKPRQ